MALPSSGALSLNQMHVEAGGSSGSQCSLNDSDIRGLISKGSGANMSFSEWHGASGVTIERAYVNSVPTAVGGNRKWSSWGYFYHPYGGGTFSSFQWTSSVLADWHSYGSNSLLPQRTHDRAYYLGQYVANSSSGGNINSSSDNTILNSCPFPAISGSVGGWYYYDKRGDTFVESDTGGDGYGGHGIAYFHANRTTSSTYPH